MSSPKPAKSSTGKMLLEPDYAEPYANWMQQPSKENTAALLKAIDPVLSTATRAYGGPSATSVNLRSRAKQLALEAMSSYDPSKGPLRSHLLSRLQRLRRVAAQQRQIIRVPEQVSLDQMSLDSAAKEFEEQSGQPPSDEELADFTGLSLRRIQYVRKGMRPVAESTITRSSEDGSGGYDPTVQSLGESANPWTEYVYTDLDPTNQFIMERALGLHGHEQMKPGDIAKQLKLSPAAISHRMAHIQQKLDMREQLGML